MLRGLYILVVLSNYFCFAFGQGANTSFVYSDFSTFTLMPVGSITATDDGGFAYVKGFQPWTFEVLDNNKLKCVNIDRNVYQSKNMDMDNVPCVFFKVSKYGRIQFAKLLGKRIGGSCIKQTKDQGYIIIGFGNITKLDLNGNKQWQILFNTDSIPGIKKSKFLTETPINDITECSDGSFIALLDASFSLLKISKAGKPLWLRSTVFEEFSPYVYNWFDNRYCDGCYYSKQDKSYKSYKGIDSTYYRVSNYSQGGGVYVPTYNIYETNDAGYIAIGKNCYRNNAYIKKIGSTSPFFKKYYIEKTATSDEVNILELNKVYEITEKPIPGVANDLKDVWDATVVVKTDKNGAVQWSKCFGDYGWSQSMANSSRSNLIKLTNDKFLIRIRDCHPTGKNNLGASTYGAAHSDFYIIDNNGNILKKPNYGQSKYLCDPSGMALAPDSSYYFYEQNIVSKADKNMSIQWQKPFGGWLNDVGIHAITADTGVLSTERGIIFKYDKYGSNSKDTIIINVGEVACLNVSNSKIKSFLHIKFDMPSIKELKNVVIVRKDINEIKSEDFVRYSYMFKEESSGSRWAQGLNYKREFEASGKKEKKTYNMPWYMFISETNIGRYSPSLKSYVLDITDTCQLHGLFCEQKKDTLPAVMVEIPYLNGYREVYITDLAEGDYVCKIINRETNEVLYKKEFTWKPEDK